MPLPQRVGYSGKPLHQKLGLKPGARAYGWGLPEAYFAWLELPGAESLFMKKPAAELDFIHVFLQTKDELAPKLGELKGYLADNGQLWASWLKGTVSDLRDHEIRAWALAHGLVDVKVCAVSAAWSGLKLVKRRNPVS
jgi:hypothetical protein